MKHPKRSSRDSKRRDHQAARLQTGDVAQGTDPRKEYLRIAIEEYEYSFAPEYQKRHMTRRAANEGTVDFGSYNAVSDVEISPDGAWVKARVWIPKKWLKSE